MLRIKRRRWQEVSAKPKFFWFSGVSQKSEDTGVITDPARQKWSRSPALIRMGFSQPGPKISGAGGVPFLSVQSRAHKFLQMSRLRMNEQFVHCRHADVVTQS